MCAPKSASFFHQHFGLLECLNSVKKQQRGASAEDRKELTVAAIFLDTPFCELPEEVYGTNKPSAERMQSSSALRVQCSGEGCS